MPRFVPRVHGAATERHSGALALLTSELGIGIFPDRAAVVRLVGAVLAEQTDEWTEQRRYMGIEILAEARQAVTTVVPQEVVPTTAISA